MARDIIRKEKDKKNLILEYTPKEFPVVVTSSASDFVSSQEENSSDFKISNLVADQVGISDLQKKSIENKIEEMALERLKKVEESAYAEAYELGLIDGTKKAFEDRQVEFEDQFQKIKSVLHNFQDIKKKLLVENESTFLKLIYEIASKIALKNIDEDKDSIIDMLGQLVEEIQTDDKILVKVSSEDMIFLESYQEKSGSKLELLDRIRLESSDSIAAGGCFVETNSGSIDATVNQRVDKAWELIQARLPKHKNMPIESHVNSKNSSDDDSGEAGDE